MQSTNRMEYQMRLKKKKESKVGFLCGVDWQHELVNDNNHPIELFGSIKALKSKKPCWEECGIVKVTITVEKWVRTQKMLKGRK